MLLNFEFENFRSFKDRTTLTMKAGSQTTLNERLIRAENKRILPSAVIYGANASGKSNVILALKCFRDIVVCGTLRSGSLFNLELYPFAHDDNHDPIHFSIDFFNNNKRFKYVLEILVGKLARGTRKVVYESLSTVAKNGSEIRLFERDEKNVIISSTQQALSVMNIKKSFIENISAKLNANIDGNILFLTSGFKSIISGEIVNAVTDFFAEKLIIIDNFSIGESAVTIEKRNVDDDEDYLIWNKLLDIFVKAADFGPQEMRFRHEKRDDNELRLYSKYKTKDDVVLIPATLMESRGTIKMIDFAILFQKCFIEGGTLIMDEFDNALHPEIVKGIISLFGDQDLNRNGAQLIFTTHNPIYLNNKIFRRDQIIFIEKDPESYRSVLYTLADFGSEEVRNDENYLINYFKGKYSSMPYIDFSLLLKKEGEDV
ncbi:MAG: ATP-binding protein [Bacteroides sp.]|nr:ATP-binding protein [Eubacterium sp.]MCM1419388.1 ATP-binding protein [Roseburia sp.]MCM1463212.1 ATP-binding protein [Bacteroides sp.]